MGYYKVTINTESYRPQRCSAKNWEAGTVNDYMEALNGWKTSVGNLKEVRWQIAMFSGKSCKGIWDNDTGTYTPEYLKWLNKKENKITYVDKLCGFARVSDIEAYGFKQGYFNVDKVIEQLRKEGEVKIPFKWCYDGRQYIKNMDGCYMLIEKKG